MGAASLVVVVGLYIRLLWSVVGYAAFFMR